MIDSRKVPRVVQTMLQWFGYLTTIGVLAVLFFWPLSDLVKPHPSTTQLFGIGMAIMAVFVANIQAQLYEIKRKGDDIEHLSLTNVIQKVLPEGSHVKSLRIYASTTGIIMPIIRDQNLRIDKCQIMLYWFNESGQATGTREINNRTLGSVAGWKELQRCKNITNLSVCYYDHLPTSYSIIVNDSDLICGLYNPNDESPHGLDYTPPFHVDVTDISGDRLVAKYRAWFDAQYNYYVHQQKRVGPRHTTPTAPVEWS